MGDGVESVVDPAAVRGAHDEGGELRERARAVVDHFVGTVGGDEGAADTGYTDDVEACFLLSDGRTKKRRRRRTDSKISDCKTNKKKRELTLANWTAYIPTALEAPQISTGVGGEVVQGASGVGSPRRLKRPSAAVMYARGSADASGGSKKEVQCLAV